MYIAMFVIWPLVIILGIIIELNTQIQVGSGAVFGAIASLIAHGITKGDPLWLEFLIFVIVWIVFWLLFFLIFSILRKKIANKDDSYGFLKYVGKELVVHKSNKNAEYGEIKINETIFRFKNEQEIKKGEKVKIVSIDGTTCMVERV